MGGGERDTVHPMHRISFGHAKGIVPVALVVCLFLAAPQLGAQVPLSGPSLLVISQSPDDDNAFAFNLSLATEWFEVEQRNLEVVDVIPGRFDPDQVARSLGVAAGRFAVIFVVPGFPAIDVTPEEGETLAPMWALVDEELARRRG